MKMNEVTFKNLEDEEIVDIINKDIPFIFLPNYYPQSCVRWDNVSIEMNGQNKLANVECRNMHFDVQMDTNYLVDNFKSIVNYQLFIYQMNKKIPDTLLLDRIKKEKFDEVLIMNGMVNRISIEYEFTKIRTIDEAYYNQLICGKYKGKRHFAQQAAEADK